MRLAGYEQPNANNHRLIVPTDPRSRTIAASRPRGCEASVHRHINRPAKTMPVVAMAVSVIRIAGAGAVNAPASRRTPSSSANARTAIRPPTANRRTHATAGTDTTRRSRREASTRTAMVVWGGTPTQYRAAADQTNPNPTPRSVSPNTAAKKQPRPSLVGAIRGLQRKRKRPQSTKRRPPRPQPP